MTETSFAAIPIAFRPKS